MRAKSHVVELGPGRATVLDLAPGLAGEADRVGAEIARLDPGALAVDLDLATCGALAARRPAVPWLLQAACEAVQRGAPGEDPLLAYRACAKRAREKDVPLVPLLPADDAGFLLRWRARRALARAPLPSTVPDGRLLDLRHAMEAMPELALRLRREEIEAARRLARLCVAEQRPRVVALMAYPRSLRVCGLAVEEAAKLLGHG
ncbi:MAG TPA: hypothetical protein VM681_01925, partial [Candidatus Thermoplasmatota archaeon]|nr:hypothetical protein [Candidatus Thermoplasmatota archaeon]